MTTRDYPIAFFLHGDLADRRTLQSVLNAPYLLKMRKAWLPGHLATNNSTVLKSGCGFGEWKEEKEVRGVAYFVKNDDEENILRNYTGAVKVKDADFQMCAGGILGKRDWIVGKVFTNTATDEHEEGMGDEDWKRLKVMEEETEAKEDVPRVPRQGFADERTPLPTPLTEDNTETESKYCFKDALRLTEDEAPQTSVDLEAADPDEHISLLEALSSTAPQKQTRKADLRQVWGSGQGVNDHGVLEATRSQSVEAENLSR